MQQLEQEEGRGPGPAVGRGVGGGGPIAPLTESDGLVDEDAYAVQSAYEQGRKLEHPSRPYSEVHEG